MGELLGIPEWLAISLWVVTCLAIFLTYGFYVIRKAHTRLAAKRPNPTREEFMEMMTTACSAEVSEFLWERAEYYVQPRLTPHPEDELISDLRIDDEEVDWHWPREWAEARGFHESNLPDWPEGWPVTVRNFGRWLDMGPVRPEWARD